MVRSVHACTASGWYSASSRSQAWASPGWSASTAASTGTPIEFAISSRVRSRRSPRSFLSATMNPMSNPATRPMGPYRMNCLTAPPLVAVLAGTKTRPATAPTGLLADPMKERKLAATALASSSASEAVLSVALTEITLPVASVAVIPWCRAVRVIPWPILGRAAVSTGALSAMSVSVWMFGFGVGRMTSAELVCCGGFR